MQNPDTYVKIIEAVQEHIQAICGDESYARDWVLIAGVDNINGEENDVHEIRLERSPRSTAYTVTGLLNWALDCYQPTDLD